MSELVLTSLLPHKDEDIVILAVKSDAQDRRTGKEQNMILQDGVAKENGYQKDGTQSISLALSEED